jgi:hypothetical protein
MQRNIIGYDIFGRAYGPATAFGQDGGAPAALVACPPSGPAYATCPPVGGGWGAGQWDAFQAAIASRGSAVVVDAPPNKAREQYLPFEMKALGAGQTLPFVAVPAQVFKPHRLVIPSDIAGALVVTNIQIGNMPQFVASTGVIPARMLSEFSTDQLINFDTAQISQQITVTLMNISNQNIPFVSLGMKGVAVMS